MFWWEDIQRKPRKRQFILTERKYRQERHAKRGLKKVNKLKPWKLTFWSLGDDLLSLLFQTRHEDRTSPWLSGWLPWNLHEPDPPGKHISAITALHHGFAWEIALLQKRMRAISEKCVWVKGTYDYFFDQTLIFLRKRSEFWRNSQISKKYFPHVPLTQIHFFQTYLSVWKSEEKKDASVP